MLSEIEIQLKLTLKLALALIASCLGSRKTREFLKQARNSLSRCLVNLLGSDGRHKSPLQLGSLRKAPVPWKPDGGGWQDSQRNVGLV